MSVCDHGGKLLVGRQFKSINGTTRMLPGGWWPLDGGQVRLLRVIMFLKFNVVRQNTEQAEHQKDTSPFVIIRCLWWSLVSYSLFDMLFYYQHLW